MAIVLNIELKLALLLTMQTGNAFSQRAAEDAQHFGPHLLDRLTANSWP